MKIVNVRSGAFLVTEYNEVLSGYELGQVTWLIAQDNFIKIVNVAKNTIIKSRYHIYILLLTYLYLMFSDKPYIYGVY